MCARAFFVLSQSCSRYGNPILPERRSNDWVCMHTPGPWTFCPGRATRCDSITLPRQIVRTRIVAQRARRVLSPASLALHSLVSFCFTITQNIGPAYAGSVRRTAETSDNTAKIKLRASSRRSHLRGNPSLKTHYRSDYIFFFKFNTKLIGKFRFFSRHVVLPA